MKIGDNISTIVVVDSTGAENIVTNDGSSQLPSAVTIIKGIPLETIDIDVRNLSQGIHLHSISDNNTAKNKTNDNIC